MGHEFYSDLWQVLAVNLKIDYSNERYGLDLVDVSDIAPLRMRTAPDSGL